jgi:hypothetical protein
MGCEERLVNPEGLERACNSDDKKVECKQTFFNIPFDKQPQAVAVHEVCTFVDSVLAERAVARREICGLHLIKSSSCSRNVGCFQFPIDPRNVGVLIYSYTTIPSITEPRDPKDQTRDSSKW